MRCASTIQLLVILIISTSCGTQHHEAQDKSKSRPQAIEIKASDQPKLSLASGEAKNYVPGEILIKFKAGTTDQVKEAIQREVHLETIRLISKPNLYLMKILDGSSVERVMERLGKFKEIEHVEPNYVRTTP